MLIGTEVGVPPFRDTAKVPVGVPEPVTGFTAMEIVTGVVPVYGDGLLVGETKVIVVVVWASTTPLPVRLTVAELLAAAFEGKLSCAV